jgi:very-short-patch-repair endonuclease
MGQKIVHSAERAWALAGRQHGVVTRAQLLELGYSSDAIQHRIAKGRLHPVWSGVYAVGRPQLTRYGRWMAAVLSCGSAAVLSHESAAALLAIHDDRGDAIHVSVPARINRRRPGIVVHRRTFLVTDHATLHHGIPVTTPALTIVDLATRVPRDQVEAAINEADKRGLIDPEALRAALPDFGTQPGTRVVREILDRHTFRLTDSELERRFLPITRRAGLPVPETARYVNGFKVDFFWPELGLAVETDGLRYHRTPAQQARDRLRDQAHAAAGLASLRFTHAQVRFEPQHVEETLRAVAGRLRSGQASD